MGLKRKKPELERLRDSLPLGKKRGRQTLKQFAAYDFTRNLYYINIGKKEVGAKSSRYKSFKDPMEAQKFLEERMRVEEQNKSTAAILTRETVGQHFEKWFTTRRFETKSNGIFYQNTIFNHIIPELGAIELYALTPDDIDAYLDVKLDTLSASTVRKHQDVLKMGLKKAVTARKITFNPMDGVEPIRVKKETPEAYSIEEVKEILQICKQEDSLYARMTIIALFTGCRRGEILGLQYENVHLETETPYIDIVKTRGNTDIGIETSDTKTRRSNRAIALTPALIDLFTKTKREYEHNKDLLDKVFHDNDFVICYEDGTVSLPSSISKGYRKMLKRNAKEKWVGASIAFS